LNPWGGAVDHLKNRLTVKLMALSDVEKTSSVVSRDLVQIVEQIPLLDEQPIAQDEPAVGAQDGD